MSEAMEIRTDFGAQIKQFVRESDTISGIEFDSDSPGYKRHLDIALILATQPFKFVGPTLVNYALTGRTGGVFRVNTEFTQLGLVPEASEVMAYVSAWELGVRNLLSQRDFMLQYELEEECWRLHHALVCILPFREATSRTARLMLLHIRTLLGLPCPIISNDQAGQYHTHLRAYRTNVFLPALRQEGAPAE